MCLSTTLPSSMRSLNCNSMLRTSETQPPEVLNEKLDTIVSGDTTVVRFQWTPTQPGIYRIEAELDPEDMVLESDKFNNIESRNILVEEPESPDPPDVTRDPGFTLILALIIIGVLVGVSIFYLAKKKRAVDE